MSASTPNRIGQINAAGATDALFNKVAVGEVLAAFKRSTEFESRHTVRTIQSGKSAQFNVSGRHAGAYYHTPGNEILGSIIKQAERVITIDGLLIADHYLADIDEAMAHWDVRSEATSQIGEELATAFDLNVARVGVLAARATSTIDTLPGGSRILNINIGTDVDLLAAAHFTAAQTFAEKYVPIADATSYLKPAQYYLLAQSTKVINKDWGGEGSYAQGTVKMLANIPLLMTNNLPSTNVATGPSAYQGNFTATRGLIMTKGAVGTVKLMDVAVRTDYDPRRLGWLMVGKYACGHGILRPESAIELATA